MYFHGYRQYQPHCHVALQMDDLHVLQKLSTAIETQLGIYPDADYNDIIEDLKIADQLHTDQKNFLKRVKNQTMVQL